MKREELIEIMNTHGDYLKNTAFHVLHDLSLAEDMVQETFISVYQKNQFKGESSMKTYLYSVLMNHIKMYLRKNKIKEVSSEIFVSKQSIFFEEKSINSMDLSYAISELNENYKLVIILFYYEDLSIVEISKILKKSKGSVKMSLKRGKDHLKRMLGAYDEDRIS